MRIWDLITLNHELDMLQFRLAELEDSPVWRHVVVEAPVTHRGEPKPLYFAENRTRFAPWADRIVHVTASVPSAAQAPGMGPWERLRAQRNCTRAALADASPDDRLLISDVDEIPSAAVWGAVPPVLLMQRVACFAVDWLWPVPEPCGVLVSAGQAVSDLAGARDARGAYPPLHDAGWHLSWMGGHQAQLAKLAAHCHLEQDTPEIVSSISSGRSYAEGWHMGVKLLPVDVDASWPRFVRDGSCPASWFRPRGESGES